MWVKAAGGTGNGNVIEVDGAGFSARIYDSYNNLVGFEGCTVWGLIPTIAQTNFAIDAHVSFPTYI